MSTPPISNFWEKPFVKYLIENLWMVFLFGLVGLFLIVGLLLFLTVFGIWGILCVILVIAIGIGIHWVLYKNGC